MVGGRKGEVPKRRGGRERHTKIHITIVLRGEEEEEMEKEVWLVADREKGGGGGGSHQASTATQFVDAADSSWPGGAQAV